MKFRMGFVSNSSSSSFIIAYKNEKLDGLLKEAFNLPDTFPLKGFGNLIADFFINSIEETFDCERHYRGSEYYQNQYEEGDDDSEDEILNLIKKGYTVGMGNAASDNDAIEALICDSDFEYESENLIILKDGGF